MKNNSLDPPPGLEDYQEDSDKDDVSVSTEDSDSDLDIESTAAVHPARKRRRKKKKKKEAIPLPVLDEDGEIALPALGDGKENSKNAEPEEVDDAVEKDAVEKDAIDLKSLGKNRRSIVNLLNKFKDEVPDEFYDEHIEDVDDDAHDGHDNEDDGLTHKKKRGTVCYLEEWQGKLNKGKLYHKLDRDKQETADDKIKCFLDKLVDFIRDHNLVALTKGQMQSSYKTELKKYLTYFYIIKCLNKLPEQMERPYFQFDEYTKWLYGRDLTDGSKWFIDIIVIIGYYSDVIPILTIKPSNVGRFRHAMQQLVTVESCNYATRMIVNELNIDLTKEASSTQVWKIVIKKQKESYYLHCKATNKKRIEPMEYMKHVISRRDLVRIITHWVLASCYGEMSGNLKRSSLEAIVVLLLDWKTMLRFDTISAQMMKNLQVIQEGDDPPLLGHLIPRGDVKVVNSCVYPACTVRDKNPLIDEQFFSSMHTMITCNSKGGEMSFLLKPNVGSEHWGNMMLIDTKKSTIFKETRDAICNSKVKSSKVLHQRSCGIDHLTRSYGTELGKSCAIVYDAIKAVSQHANEKAFDSYAGWYQFGAWAKSAGYPLNMEYWLSRENLEIPDNMHQDQEVQVDWYVFLARFLKEFFSEGSDRMEQSRHFLFVVIPYTLYVIFQDAHYWLTNHPDCYFSYYIKERLGAMRNKEKQRKLKEFFMNGAEMVEKIEKAHEEMLKESTVREANINQHVSKHFMQNELQLNQIRDSISDGYQLSKTIEQATNSSHHMIKEVHSNVEQIKEMMLNPNYVARMKSKKKQSLMMKNCLLWNMLRLLTTIAWRCRIA